MSMDRRDFVRHLALLAAGAAALPQQIAAFEQYYDLNTVGSTALAAVDEIVMSGMAQSSLPVSFNLFVAGEPKLPGIGCNLFGGIFRWLAAPDQKIVAPADQITWLIKSTKDIPQLKKQFVAHISFIGQDGIRQTIPLLACRGSLA